MNQGKNAGRICWAVAGTFSTAKARGACGADGILCTDCDFFKKVNREEERFVLDVLRPPKMQASALMQRV